MSRVPPPPASKTNEAIASPREVPLSYLPPNLTSNAEIPLVSPVDWSSGLCGCFSDIPNCLITCFCPCIIFGQISEIVDEGTSSCAINGAIYALFTLITGIPCIFSCFYRRKMRYHYNLKGNACGDCCSHCCCELCALCQEYRELKLHGFDMGLGWHANIERQKRDTMRIPPSQSIMRR